MNLYLVCGIGSGAHEYDLVIAAIDATGAFQRWKAYYSEWDKPARVRVWTLPTTALPGVVEWNSLRSEEFNTHA